MHRLLREVLALGLVPLAACGPAPPAEAACRLLSPESVAAAVGRPVVARSAGPGTCGWYPAADTTAPSLLHLQLLRSEELRAEGRYPDARTFFDVTAGLAGAAFGAVPEPVAGLGEAAVWGGTRDGRGGGELWALQGDAVVGLVAAGLRRPVLERLARRAVEQLSAAAP